MEDRGKMVPENRRLSLRYGKAVRPYKMAEVSNTPFTEASFVAADARIPPQRVTPLTCTFLHLTA